jgi:hypothetical protein
MNIDDKVIKISLNESLYILITDFGLIRGGLYTKLESPGYAGMLSPPWLSTFY